MWHDLLCLAPLRSEPVPVILSAPWLDHRHRSIVLSMPLAPLDARGRLPASQLARLAAIVRGHFGWPERHWPVLAVVPVADATAALQPWDCLPLLAQRHMATDGGELHLFVVPGATPLPTAPSALQPVQARALLEGRRGAVVHLADALGSQGFAVLRLGPEHGAWLAAWKARTFQALKQYLQAVASRRAHAWREGFGQAKFVGLQAGSVRSAWQMRTPRDALWPSPQLTQDLAVAGALDLTNLSLSGQRFFEHVAQHCLARLLALWALPGPCGEVDAEAPYGASVFRVHEYHVAERETCGLHADLGLLSLAPRASAPGLRIVQAIRGTETAIDELLGEHDIVVLAGETLARITGGLVRPALHRVEQSKAESRFSAVFFQRADPKQRLPGSGQSIDIYTREILFDRRWWRMPMDGVGFDF